MFGPLGLLATCAALAIAGLYWLSFTETFVAIFAAATLYGVAKTYFWPTMLGVVSEQFPKGGALTLNAIAGIGMLAVGIIGGPLIGKMQEDTARVALTAQDSAVYEKISKDDSYFSIPYKAVDGMKVAELDETMAAEVNATITRSKQGALATIAILPAFMLVCYLLLIGYFKSKGGYRPVVVDGKVAEGH